MSSEQDKFEEEKFYFERFCRISNLAVDEGSVEKLSPPKKPDIKCKVNGNTEYFEMARMCSRDAAHMINSGNSEAQWLDDPVEDTLRKKLACTYEVGGPIHLILYDLGLIVFPPNVVVPKLQHALQSTNNNIFSSIWYLTKEQVYKVN